MSTVTQLKNGVGWSCPSCNKQLAYQYWHTEPPVSVKSCLTFSKNGYLGGIERKQGLADASWRCLFEVQPDKFIKIYSNNKRRRKSGREIWVENKIPITILFIPSKASDLLYKSSCIYMLETICQYDVSYKATSKSIIVLVGNVTCQNNIGQDIAILKMIMQLFIPVNVGWVWLTKNQKSKKNKNTVKFKTKNRKVEHDPIF